MTDLRKAAEMALEALNQATGMCAERTSTRKDVDEAIKALRQAIEAAEKIENPPIRIQNHTNIEQALSVLQQADPINHKVDVKTAMGILKQTINQEYQGSDAAKAAHMMDLYDKLGVKWGEDPFVVIEKMRKAFEQAEKQEPVAWMDVDGYVIDFDKTELQKDYAFIQPLYTAPPKRVWQGLTDEERVQAFVDAGLELAYMDYDADMKISKVIEAKLREKNT